MFVLNAALIGLISSTSAPTLIRATTCLFGLYFSYCWLLLNRKGRYYTYRWREVITSYEAELRELQSFSRLPLPLTSVSPDADGSRKAKSASQLRDLVIGRRTTYRDVGALINLIIAGFMVAWLLLLALQVISIVIGGTWQETLQVKDA